MLLRIRRGLGILASLLRETYRGWRRDHASLMAAALTYYTLISVAPLLIILLTLAGFFFGPEQGAGKVASGLGALVGPEGVALLDRWVHRAGGEASRWFATLIGLAVVIYGSTRVFTELRRTLRVIWGFPVRMSRRARALELLGTHGISFLMVVGIGLLVLLGILSSTVIAAIGTFLSDSFPEALQLARLIHSSASVILLGISLALVYRFLPGRGIRWNDVWLGALLAAVLMTLGQRGLGFYLGNTTIRSLYGAAGSVIVTLFWFYYSWMIFFFGAEFTKAYRRRKAV